MRIYYLIIVLLLSGCELLGLDDAAKTAAALAQREADGRAIGGACRHAGRALEDCYVLSPKAQKAAVFAGWREMDAYMRENKIEILTPQFTAAKETPIEVKPFGESKSAKDSKEVKAPAKDSKDTKEPKDNKEIKVPVKDNKEAKPAEKH